MYAYSVVCVQVLHTNNERIEYIHNIHSEPIYYNKMLGLRVDGRWGIHDGTAKQRIIRRTSVEKYNIIIIIIIRKCSHGGHGETPSVRTSTESSLR